MSEPAPRAPTSVVVRQACLVGGLCLAVMAAAAVLLPCPSPQTHGKRLVLCLLAVEAAALAAAVPFLAAQACKVAGWRRRCAVALLPVLGVELACVAIIAAAAGGAVPLDTLLWCHLFYLAFAWLLAALTMALTRVGVRAATAQAVTTLAAIAMLGQVFFANALVEAATGQGTKMAMIDTVLWTNPWLIAGGSILQADPLRSENLYEWSVIIYYGFQYPAAGIPAVWLRALVLSGVYATVGTILLALPWLLRRPWRRPGTVQSMDSD